MNWITRLIESPKTILKKGDAGSPEGLWEKCPGCSEMLYSKELERSLMVCGSCDYHLRLSAQSRAESLFDPESFEECDMSLRSVDVLNFKDKKRYKDRLKDFSKRVGEQDAIRNYSGSVNGIALSTSFFEFGFMGGSMGSLAGEKITRGMRRSIENKVPYLLVTASGGARMQEGVLSLMQMAKTSSAASDLKYSGQPFLCLLTDPTLGGVSASMAWLGDIILAEPGALIGFAGPRVIQETIGESLPEGFQSSEYLLEHGLIDDIVDRRKFKEYLTTTLTHLQQRSYQAVA